MTDDIDPALVRLAREYPMRIFLYDDGTGVVWTSTCQDMPARLAISGQKDTILLYPSIAATFASMDCSTYCRKEKIGYCSDVYGRVASTIETALSTIPKST